jgi:hypothetical protein
MLVKKRKEGRKEEKINTFESKLPSSFFKKIFLRQGCTSLELMILLSQSPEF